MEIKSFYFNELRECCYVVWDDSLDCVIIDPGASSEGEFARLCGFISDSGLHPVKILLTHGHFDHVMGLEDAAVKWSVPVYMNSGDLVQLEAAPEYCRMLGLKSVPFSGKTTDINDGDIIEFGNSSFEVIATPGHTQGGVCYYGKESSVLISGDTLFAGSIGRTDHIGGDYEQLMKSITAKLLPLDSDVKVLPGHGYPTTIGYERATNPFLETL
ncbi:MAG: MBL fold metallo-hydrolase [Bacteroidales bacterium]|nr:MBL fold metallo-hydrolase [Candidatus Cacconaster merdequi]